jgi:hypothetical protein
MRCVHELNESNETREQINKIKEKAKSDESQAVEELQSTVIGEI